MENPESDTTDPYQDRLLSVRGLTRHSDYHLRVLSRGHLIPLENFTIIKQKLTSSILPVIRFEGKRRGVLSRDPVQS